MRSTPPPVSIWMATTVRSFADRRYSVSILPYPAARRGPMPRLPSGGYLHAPTAACACDLSSIIGNTTPSAPQSSARPARLGSPGGVRTSAAARLPFMDCSRRCSDSMVSGPCSRSKRSQSNPWCASISVTSG